jgi:hypothetical protein
MLKEELLNLLIRKRLAQFIRKNKQKNHIDIYLCLSAYNSHPHTQNTKHYLPCLALTMSGKGLRHKVTKPQRVNVLN